MNDNPENRIKLIESAKKEFMEKGFNKASLRKISADAGLTTGAIYFFFKDKNGLFGAIVDKPLKKIMDIVTAHYSEEASEDFNIYEHKAGDHDELAELLVPALYEDRDAMLLLLEKSAGSKYEDIVDKLIAFTDQTYLKLGKGYSDTKNEKKVNEYMLHYFSHLQINAFVHLIIHEPDEKKALKHIKPLIDFMVDGWMKYILEDKDI